MIAAALVLLALGSAADTVPRPEVSTSAGAPVDSWLGPDKWRHLVLSFAATSFSAAGARAAAGDPHRAALLGAAVGFGLGVGKELADRRGRGTASWKDLFWDALGVMAATALAAGAG